MGLIIKMFGHEVFSYAKKSTNISASDLDQIFNPEGVGTITENNAYRLQDSVYVCINQIAQNIGRVPFTFFNKGSDREIISGAVVSLFNNINPITSSYQLREGTFIFKLMKGECFWYLERSSENMIANIWFIHPSNMSAITDKNTGALLGWKWTKGGKTITLDPDEVFHHKFFNPYDFYRGLSPLKAAMKAITIDNEARDFDQAILQNGSSPNGILKINDAYDKNTEKRIRKSWEDRHKGSKKAGKTALLFGDIDYKELSLTPEEIKYIEQRKMTRKEIHSIYKVPTAITGDTDAFNRSNMQDIILHFWNTTIITHMENFVSDINENFMPRYFPDTEMRMSVDNIPEVQAKIADKIDNGEKLWKMGVPLFDINEKLKLGFDLSPYPWAKLWWIGFNQVPAGTQLEGVPTEEPKEDPPEEESFKSLKTVIKRIEKISKDSEHRKFKIWKSFIQSIQPVTNRYSKKVSSWIFELRRTVLSNFLEESTSFEQKAIEDNLFNKDEQTKLLMSLSTPFIEEATRQGANSLLEDIALTPAYEITSPAALSFVDERRRALESIVDTIDKKLRDSIAKGFDEGLTTNEIADLIRHDFDVTAHGAKRIARTEMTGAANGGRELGMIDNGIERKQWLHSFDDDVRTEHLIGDIAEVGEEFSIGLKYPGDKTGSGSTAANVINCRCTMLAVIEELEE